MSSHQQAALAAQQQAANAAAAPTTMFYVKHHNDEISILNSKCPTALLMDRLHKLGDLPSELSTDLFPLNSNAPNDHKNQHPLMMHERIEANATAIYANTYIQPRATYILLSAQEDEDGVRLLRPVWKSSGDDQSDKLAATLESRAADEKKKLSSKKSKK